MDRCHDNLLIILDTFTATQVRLHLSTRHHIHDKKQNQVSGNTEDSQNFCSKNRNGSRKVYDMSIEMEPEQLPCDWVWPVELGSIPTRGTGFSLQNSINNTLGQRYKSTWSIKLIIHPSGAEVMNMNT